MNTRLLVLIALLLSARALSANPLMSMESIGRPIQDDLFYSFSYSRDVVGWTADVLQMLAIDGRYPISSNPQSFGTINIPAAQALNGEYNSALTPALGQRNTEETSSVLQMGSITDFLNYFQDDTQASDKPLAFALSGSALLGVGLAVKRRRKM